jgi:SAM-dependent methyltransferase
MLGRRVLEIGCGGGQAAIALARQGATVSAIDLSAAQLAHARRLAAAEGVAVEFLLGDAASLSLPPSIAAFDLILSVNTFQYVAGMPECLHACHALLRAGGRLVFSLDHPLRTCFLDADAPGSDEELSIIPARSYFDRRPLRWRWGTTGIALQTYHRTVAEWCDFLAAAGFTLRRIVEPPPPPATLDNVYPPDDALAPLRLIPHTIIFVAEKS